VSATATINVVPLPNAGTNTSVNLCSNLGSIDLTSYLNGSPETTGDWFQGGNPIVNPFNISTLGGTTQVFTYTVDNGTCSSSSTLTINVQNPPLAGPDQTVNLCATGAAFNLNTILNGAAQTPGVWTNPVGVAGNNITLNTAASGVYTYTVAGTACASDAALYTLVITNAITATVTTTCNAAQTGYTVVITMSGGTGVYTVDGTSVAGNVYTSGVINTPNNYSFSVDDNGPCPAIVVSGASPVCTCPATASFAGGNQTICNGGSANIVINTPGGTAPWTIVYSANGVNQPPVVINTSGSSITVSPAVNTTYALVSVTDANCVGSATGSLTINVVNPPNAGPDVNPVDLCASGANLPLNTILNGGAQTGGNWTNSAGTPLTSIPIVVASSGVYTYTVVNTPCPADAALYTINITDQISVTGITATCNAAQTGYTVVFSISGGTGTYSVSSSLGLTGTLTGNIFTTDLIPTGNNYGFTVSDTGPCADATINGAAPNCTCPATASFAGGNQTICNGSSANIVINTPAGTAPWTIVYSANGVNQPPVVINTSGSSITVSPTVNTTYALVSVNDANCAGSASGSLTINVVNQPTAGPDVVTNLCASGTNLTLNSILNAGAAAGGTWTNSTGTIVTTIPVNIGSSGAYTYTVTNAPCPADAATYTINISDPISVTGITATCNAAQTNYTLVFTISGGAGGYTVTSPSGLTGTLTGNVFTSAPITSGQNYDYEVSDAGPCPNAPVIGAAPNCNCPATASFAGGNQTICNGSSAALTVTTAGASPWTIVYSANGVNQPSVVINASGGTFTVSPTVNTTYALVSVNDANCTGSATGSLTVNVVNPPNAGPNVTIDTCGTGGNLVLNTILDNAAQGGGTWTNSGGNTVTTLPLTSASSGVYTYTVTNTPCPADAAQYTLNISAPITISGLTAVCNAAQTGYTVSFTINGGAGGLAVSSPTGLTGTLAGNVFTSSLITSGTVYDFEVSDTGPCDNVVVGGQSPNCNCNVTGSITGTTNICTGNCATITFNLQGSEPFDVVYQNSNDPFNPVLLTDIFNGHTITVCPTALTTYTLLSVTDNNCTGVVQGNAVVITVNPPVTISNITETCDALGENYTVVFTVTGGVPPIVVTATGITPPAGTFNAATGVYTSAPIPAGSTYSYSVSSAGACPAVIVSGSFSCGCTTSAGEIQTNPIVICTNETAQVVTTVAATLDGNDVFQYILHNGTANTLGTILATSPTGAFTFGGGLIAGQTYYITAIAGNGNGQGGVNQNDPCFSAALGVSVVFNALPSANISGNSTVCPGSAVDFNVNFTGTGPWNYTYSINGNGTTTGTSQTNTSTISGNTPGTYVIQTVTDSNCPGTTTGVANLNNFTAPTATLAGNPNVCAGSGDGPEITFTGQGPWTFTYSLDGSVQNSITTSFPTYTIPAQTSGLYSLVSVQDVNCSGAASGLLAVNVLANPTAQITGGGTVCQGNSAPFTLQLTGNGPFSVLYSVGGVPQPVLNGVMNGHTFQSGVAGNYNVITVTDQACTGTGTSGNASLQVNALPHGEILTNSNVLCVGQQLTLTFSMEGTPPYNLTYIIDGDTISLSGVPNNFTQILNPTESVVSSLIYVEDSSNPTCVSNTPASAFVLVGELPNAPVLANYTICSGADALSIGAPPVDGLSYSWSPTTGLSDANISNPTIQLSIPGVTPRTFVYTLTTTNGECEAVATSEITVDPGPRANFSFSPSPVSSIDPTVRFQNLSDASETTGYYWEFDVFGTSILQNPTFKFPEGVDATYTVTLNAIDLLTGCSDSHTDLIKVRPEMLVFVPNAFTPDGDGINDLWGPVMANIDENEYRLSVFDRTGRIIFQTLDPDKKWNGSINDGEFYAQNAVYVWLIETKNKLTSEELEFRGIVTVVR
jgi:gliding motility-associated-like protein